ncbi:DUF3137 domain-containing protein [Brachybacterium sp. AOP25-B2-12]|uniref:DUF3137 domain-containing protein n=1 Tax=Brachybacterium sp. AOP25-B2-12 TaxID=3457710 RepID=UPI0040343A31
MITVPTVDDVLQELGRSPDDLDARAAASRDSGRPALTRGTIGVVVGLSLVVTGAIGSSVWHWLWAVVLGTGMILTVAGVVGIAAGIRAARDARDFSGREVIDTYLTALARRLDAQNPARAGVLAPEDPSAPPVASRATHLVISHEGEGPGMSLDAVRACGLFPHAVGATVDDLLTGWVLGIRFEIRELAVQVEATYPHGGSYRSTAFDGLLTGVRLQRPLPATVQVLGRERGPALRGTEVGLAEVATGDAAFDRVFEVWASGATTPEVLTDTVRARLLRLADDGGTDDVAFAFEGDAVFCAMADDKDMFEASGEASLLTQLASLHEDMALSVRLVDVLGAAGR